MVTIKELTAEHIQAHQADLVALLEDVVNKGASVSFLAPLDTPTAAAYWRKVAAEVGSGERKVLVAQTGDGRIVGCAHLVLISTPNGVHRAEVQKVLVLTAFRRQGIALALMNQLDQLAQYCGRTLLVLDTAHGSGAEPLYERCGYQRVGIIPNFAIGTYGGLIDTVVYYKLL